MTIKELSYSAQQHLRELSGKPFKRSHVCELLAASFGFKSYAAFGAGAVFTRWRPDEGHTSANGDGIRQRCLELGYSKEVADLAASALPTFLKGLRIGVAKISDLVENPDDWNDPDGEGFEPIIVEGLVAAASRGHASAHYALAWHYERNEADSDTQVDNPYWRSQAEQGRVLTGVEKVWAEAYAKRVDAHKEYVHHLREAARLGNSRALLDLANQFDDPAFFEQSHKDVEADPSAVAEIAERLGRNGDARRWLTVAAEACDIDAMRQLIEVYDRHDPLQCWTWVYLAQLLGTDLLKDDYFAIDEDGSPYDDDVGGPAYVDGRAGRKLDALNVDDDSAARHAAEAMFQRSQLLR